MLWIIQKTGGWGGPANQPTNQPSKIWRHAKCKKISILCVSVRKLEITTSCGGTYLKRKASKVWVAVGRRWRQRAPWADTTLSSRSMLVVSCFTWGFSRLFAHYLSFSFPSVEVLCERPNLAWVCTMSAHTQCKCNFQHKNCRIFGSTIVTMVTIT